MLSLPNIYTLYFRLYFRLCICLNKLSINQPTRITNIISTQIDNFVINCLFEYTSLCTVSMSIIYL